MSEGSTATNGRVAAPRGPHAGPEELLRLKREHLIPCGYHFYRRPPQLVRGEGCWLFGHDGKRFLDCFAGVTVVSAGHANPAIVEPAIEQLRQLQHTTSIYLTEPVLRLAEKLGTLTPPGLTRSFFTASGTEAVEGALLAAALHTGRPNVLAATHGLHGRTRWAMNVTGAAMWRTDPFPVAGVTHVPFGDAEALARHLEEHGHETAAFVFEPIQGNGGVNVPPPGYLAEARRLCTAHGVLLVLDEIQTGLNRTGSWFASIGEGVSPDLMAVSKALGNGFPVAAFVATEAVAASYTKPGASTYGGNLVSATAALATLRFHEEHRLGDAAAERGAQLLAGLRELAGRKGGLGEPRGRGLMLGLPVLAAGAAGAAERCDGLLEDLKDAGVLVGKTGPGRDVLTFLPPLVISETQIGVLLDALDHVLD